LKAGNLASIVQGKLIVSPPHGNTSKGKCCTSFVNSGDPYRVIHRFKKAV
jgi:hypothetical protein